MAARVMPTVRRRRLGELLRQLRVDAELSVEDVAAQFEWSPSKLYRIERAAHGVAVSDVRLLLEQYRVPEQQRAEVVALVREARQRGWWRSYGDALPEPFAAYVGLEQDAASLWQYSAELVPGLLQTEDYARAIRRAALWPDTDETAARWIAVRSRRQARLAADDPLTCSSVLNEAVLARVAGGPDVMRAQLRHLVRLAALPTVTVQILPFGVGAHPAMDGSFTIIRFADRTAADVVYTENQTTCHYLERDSDVQRFTVVFDQLRAQALDPEQSLAAIRTAAEAL